MSRHDTTDSRPRRNRLLLGALVGGSLVLLAATTLLSAAVYRQSQTLDANVSVTAGIVNANVRTIGQVQRELLRTAAILESGAEDVDDLEQKRAFTTQRMREVTLSYQLQTLGTVELLDRARALSDRWFREVEPAVESVIAGDRSMIDGALSDIREIELEFNDLASQGELNRKKQAGMANDSIIAMLASARQLFVGLGASFGGFVVVVLATAVGYRRFDRQREEASRRLLSMNAELRSLSEVASRTGNLVVITDALGRIEWVNEAFEQVTGHALDRVLGLRPGAFLQGPDTDPETVERMSTALRAGEGFTCEVLNYARSGRPYWVAIEVCPVTDSEGRLTNFIAVETDITEEIETREHLRTAKESAEEVAEQKGQFLATMSHEIRTPLNAVIGLTDLLLDGDLDDQQREFVQQANESGALLLSTINNILTYSAAEAGTVELECRDFEVRGLAEQVHTMLRPEAEAKGLELRLAVDVGVPTVLRGDDTRLRQVLVNLVGNAVKFTEHGSVDVRLGSGGSVGDRHRVEVTVADTGIGIAPDRLDHLFEPFVQADATTTRRYGGSGLGLAIADRIVALMGGAISVDSVEGRGTTFTFDVVLGVGSTIRPSSDDDASDWTCDPDLEVLVAEDDPVNQLVVTHMLRRIGCEPTIVDDGAAAVDAVLAGSFDIVLMDVQMPVLDGVSAVARIDEVVDPAERPRIVALTANALDGDRDRLLAGGMDGYLSKPVQLADLRSTLRSMQRTLDLDDALSAPLRN